MLKEIIISIYLFIFKLIFNLFKSFPIKHKVILIASFGDNIHHIIHKLPLPLSSIILLVDREIPINGKDSTKLKSINIQSKNPITFIYSIYHLATSKTVFIDNYFGFLAVTNFKPEVKVIQLWHAAGAVKKFGLQDPSIKQRTERANKRFRSVYNRFDHVVVGSDKMVDIFKESFGVDESQFLTTGVPRTDFFFQENKIKDVQQQLIDKYPIIKGKKVILYAPTFREEELHAPKIHLDFNRMFEKLRNDYVLLLKLHPAVANKHSVHIPSFVLDVSNHQHINHLLTITDILITDYSSIPVEFSLLQKPMIFYPYDLESYQKKRGFWEPYEESMPGPVAYSTEEIVNIIIKNDFNMEKVKQFSEEWNKYSNGESTLNLIHALQLEKHSSI